MNHDQLPAHSRAHAEKEAQLLDQCRAAEAVLYGKRIEIAMHAGLREDADFWRESMEKVVRERRSAALGAAEQRGEDFFTAAAAHDAASLRVRFHSAPEHSITGATA
jgi:hypothetical protein